MLTYATAFSGIEGFGLGFDRAGMTPLWQCEIDDAASRVLAHHYPDVPNHRDITTIPRDVPQPDVYAAGVPCFPAGTLVDTADGLLPIEQVRQGDLVMTHRRRRRPVTRLMRREADDTVAVKIMGAPEFVATPTHPFWSRPLQRVWDNPARTYRRTWLDPEWKYAADLTVGDFVGMPVDEPDPLIDPLGEPFALLIGRWLGDGWIIDYPRKGRRDSHHRKAILCCTHGEADQVASLIREAGYHGTPVRERTVTKFHISSAELVKMLGQFGRGAEGKRLPGWVFSLPRADQRALFQGWADADGSVQASGQIRVTTVSPQLAHGMSRVARNGWRRATSVHFSKMPETCVIEGRTVRQRDMYQVCLPVRNREAFYEDGWVWAPVRSVNPAEPTTVFDLTVDEDESFTAWGIAVHNCQDVSVAGRRKGLAGERTGLFYAWAEHVDAVRPRWIVFENVPGLLSSNDGRDMGTVLNVLADLGYEDISWRVVDALGFGVPQRRRRLFIVGRLGTGTRSRQVLLESEGREWRPPSGGEAGPDVAATLTAGVGTGRPPGRRGEDDRNLVAAALTAQGVGTCGVDDNQAQAGHLVARMQAFGQYADDGTASTVKARDGKDATDLVVASTLTASAGHHGHSSPRGDGTDNLVPVTSIDWQAGGSGDESWRGKARSWIHREHYTGALSTTKTQAVFKPGTRVRRLTPVECERLQGFPDGWTVPAGTDSARYRCIGNAVAVPVAGWIGDRIIAVERAMRAAA